MNVRRFAGALATTLGTLALLGGCTPAPQPVRYFASGYPAKLSEWHLVEARGGKLATNAGVVPYDLATPLFSDYAHKFRTVWMPKGVSAKYDSYGPFDFPVGTVLSKTFFYPMPEQAKRGGKSVARTWNTALDFAPGAAHEALDLANVRLVETRLLVRRDNGWEAIPYVWDANQKDAHLARTGDVIPLELVDDTGQREAFPYVVPNANQCAGCHVTNVQAKRIDPLGPHARHLNHDYAYLTGKENQLAHWAEVGYLTGLPRTDVPHDAAWNDTRAPLDARARGWLDINCSHCHSPTGPANTTALDLRSVNPDARLWGVCKPPVAAGRGTGDRLFDIVPGQPDGSILVYRITSHENGVMMPEMGRNTTDKEGVALVRAWIASLPGACAS